MESFLESMPFGIIVLDQSGTVRIINPMATELLDIATPIHKLQGGDIIQIIGHVPSFTEELSRFLKNRTLSFFDDSIIVKSRILNLSVHLIRDGILLVIRDVTREKELETNSIQSILASQENERRRVAREIHDGIAPMLSSAKLELDLFMEELQEAENCVPDERLQSLRQTIDTIATDLRDLSHRLIPRILEDFGLLAACQNLVSKVNLSVKLKVEFFCNLDSGERFSPDLELNLFRCAQELLSNAVKYANANRIMVQVIRHKKSIVLMVEDDGTGFDPQEVSREGAGIGLTNVETRVRSLNGNFIVESEKGRGTLMSIEIPC
jgi:signal transduction histidine kinase